jgi:hypothetical protein
MTTIHKKKNNKNTTGSVFALVAEVTTAAVAITGVAVAATTMLKNKKIRGKVIKVLKNVKDQTTGYVKAIKTELNAGEEISVAKKTVVGAKKVAAKVTIEK